MHVSNVPTTIVPASPLRRRATSVEECSKKPRRNAALTLRACRYRGPSRQPSRLCCSGCLRTLPFPPYLGRAWWPICTDCPTCTYDLLTCTYDDLPTCTYDDLWIDNLLQVRTCLRVRTQKPMLLSQVSWSFSLDFTKPESTHHDCLGSKPSHDFCSKPSSARQKPPSCSHRTESQCSSNRPRAVIAPSAMLRLCPCRAVTKYH